MTSAVLQLHLLVLGIEGIPAEVAEHLPVLDRARQAGSTETPYFEWLELNTHIVYPALAVVVVALMLVGVLYALQTDGLDSKTRRLLRERVIRELRLDLRGVPTETLSAKLGVPPKQGLALMTGLAEDGIVVNVGTEAATRWQLCGLSDLDQR